MSDYDTQHARHHGRPMDYSNDGSGIGLWIVLGLLAVLALIGILMAGSGGGTVDGAAPATAEPGVIEPATGTGAPN